MYKIQVVLSPTVHPLKVVHGWADTYETEKSLQKVSKAALFWTWCITGSAKHIVCRQFFPSFPRAHAAVSARRRLMKKPLPGKTPRGEVGKQAGRGKEAQKKKAI